MPIFSKLRRAGAPAALACAIAGAAAAGPEGEAAAPRRAVRTTVPSPDALSHPKPVALGDLIRLAAPPGIADDDPRYRAARIPEFPNPLGLKEGDIVATSGWLRRVAAAHGAYLLELAQDKAGAAHGCLVAGVPDPDRIGGSPVDPFLLGNARAAAAAMSLVPLYKDVREAVRNVVLLGADPKESGKPVPPMRISIVGQLFFAGSAVAPGIRDPDCAEPAPWELYPVTRAQLGKIAK
ncbi:MAG TPA: hypothetical protein VFA50_21095 [Stellaceae bacterium]|nr:hypothetical protein [Stellaceae bacterium]